MSTAGAKLVCANDIPVSVLNGIILKPAYSNRVKVKLTSAMTLEVMVGKKMLSKKKSGILSPNGVLSVSNNGLTIRFRLKKAGDSGYCKPIVKKNPVTPALEPEGNVIVPRKNVRT